MQDLYKQGGTCLAMNLESWARMSRWCRIRNDYVFRWVCKPLYLCLMFPLEPCDCEATTYLPTRSQDNGVASREQRVVYIVRSLILQRAIWFEATMVMLTMWSMLWQLILKAEAGLVWLHRIFSVNKIHWFQACVMTARGAKIWLKPSTGRRYRVFD